MQGWAVVILSLLSIGCRADADITAKAVAESLAYAVMDSLYRCIVAMLPASVCSAFHAGAGILAMQC